MFNEFFYITFSMNNNSLIPVNFVCNKDELCSDLNLKEESHVFSTGKRYKLTNTKICRSECNTEYIRYKCILDVPFMHNLSSKLSPNLKRNSIELDVTDEFFNLFCDSNSCFLGIFEFTGFASVKCDCSFRREGKGYIIVITPFLKQVNLINDFNYQRTINTPRIKYLTIVMFTLLLGGTTLVGTVLSMKDDNVSEIHTHSKIYTSKEFIKSSIFPLENLKKEW